MPDTPFPERDAQCRTLAAQLFNEALARGMNAGRIYQASIVAALAHCGVQRKTGEPYVQHCLTVALLLLGFGGGEDDAVAALLHDVVEDTGMPSEVIERRFGPGVAQRVMALTKNPAIVSSAERTLEAHGRLLQATASLGPGAALIKLADRLHNSATAQVLRPGKLRQMQAENRHLFAPLASWVGAHGLAQILGAEPEIWWSLGGDLVAAARRAQPPVPLCLGR